MAKNENKKTSEAKVKVVASNIADAYVDYAVKAQLKAADVPPRKTLDIKFTDTSKIGDTKSKTNQEAYEKAHGKLYDMTHKNTVPWKNWVVYIVLISMLSCCFTFSKYISNGTGVSSAAVAKFCPTISGTANDITIVSNSASITFDSDKGEKTCKFTIINDSEVLVSVTPIASSYGGYTVAFYDDETSKPIQYVDQNNKTQNSGSLMTIPKIENETTSSKTIRMVINPTGVSNKTTTNMTLNIRVDQVD